LLQEHSAVIEANETRIFRASELESSVSTQATAALQQHLGKEGGKNKGKKNGAASSSSLLWFLWLDIIQLLLCVWHVRAELEHVRGSFFFINFFFLFLFFFVSGASHIRSTDFLWFLCFLATHPSDDAFDVVSAALLKRAS